MTFNFEIAIPSYNRHSILPKKTLELLNKFEVPHNKIRIFLKTQEELDLYLETCGDDYNYEITGQSGIMATRNYLQVFYHEMNDEFDGLF